MRVLSSQLIFTYYRYYNMMEETFLINIIKEKLCYVSQNFLQDLASTKRQVTFVTN
jgi:hypothetical protein